MIFLFTCPRIRRTIDTLPFRPSVFCRFASGASSQKEESVKCWKCGKQNSDYVSFCDSCGSILSGTPKEELQDATPSPSLALCKACKKQVRATFHGCCPNCGKFL
ncbi:MAG: zinc-ribbon domain-containing protein [Spirochaetia bacterium]